MTITELGKTECQLLQKEAEKALIAVADQYGLSLIPKGGRYGDTNLALRFEFRLPDDGAMPKDFPMKAKLLGVPEDCFGKSFMQGGSMYTITDLNLRRPKFPVSAKRNDGRGFKFSSNVTTRAK